jgi:hypothetical protein
MWGTTAFRPSHVWDLLKFLLGEGDAVSIENSEILQITGLWLEQRKKNDICRDVALWTGKHGFPLVNTMTEALVDSSGEYVDIVWLVPEHGRYTEHLNQPLYPIRDWLETLFEFIRSTGWKPRILVIDKNVFLTVRDYFWLARQLEELGIPCVGGSVLPWHEQSVSLPAGPDVEIQDIVVLGPPWIGNMGVHGAATYVSCAASCRNGGQIPRQIEHLEGTDRVQGALDEGRLSRDCLDAVCHAILGKSWDEHVHVITESFWEARDTVEGVIYEFDDWTAGQVTAGGLGQWGTGMRVKDDIHAACCRFDLDQFGLMCRDIADMAVNGAVPSWAQTLTYWPSALTVWAIASHNLGRPVCTHELGVSLSQPHSRPPRAPLPVL